MSVDDAMKRYEKAFGEMFPLYCCMGMKDDEIASKIMKHVESGKRFKPRKGVMY